MHLKLSGVVNHEENERGWNSLENLNNDHFLAYVGGPRFINPTFYSLANFISQLASMYREAVSKHFLSAARASHSAFIITVEREYDLHIFTHW